MFSKFPHVAMRKISVRFANFEAFRFDSLLDFKKFKVFQNNFPQSAFSCLVSTHKRFDSIWLKNELTILYKDAEFEGKEIHGLVLYLAEISRVLPGVY